MKAKNEKNRELARSVMGTYGSLAERVYRVELPKHLNALPPHSEVFVLIRACQELRVLGPQIDWSKVGPIEGEGRTNPDRIHCDRARLWSVLLDRIDVVLQRYQFTPQLDGSCSFVHWYVEHPRARMVDGKILLTDQIREESSIAYLLEMMSLGDFDRLRQCDAPGCGRWFVAKRNKQRVCNDSCRFRKYQSKQSVKAKRREYMREYLHNPRVKARLRAKAKKAEKSLPTRYSNGGLKGG